MAEKLLKRKGGAKIAAKKSAGQSDGGAVTMFCSDADDMDCLRSQIVTSDWIIGECADEW